MITIWQSMVESKIMFDLFRHEIEIVRLRKDTGFEISRGVGSYKINRGNGSIAFTGYYFRNFEVRIWAA